MRIFLNRGLGARAWPPSWRADASGVSWVADEGKEADARLRMRAREEFLCAGKRAGLRGRTLVCTTAAAADDVLTVGPHRIERRVAAATDFILGS